MSLLFSTTRQRVQIQDVRQYSILANGIDNLYPQLVEQAVNGSGQAFGCVSTLAEYIEGKGFKDTTFYKAVVNNDGDTMDFILKQIAKDMAYYGTRCYLLKYNVFGEVNQVYHIHAEYVRKGIKEHQGQYAVYDDWAKERSKQIKKDDIRWYDAYDPDKVLEQMEKAGGVTKYKGQILYISAEGKDAYGLAPIDPEIESAISDAQIKTSHFWNLATGFMNNSIIVASKIMEQDEADEMTQALTEFQGAENTSKTMFMPGTDPESIKVIPLDSASQNNKFTETEASVRERIRKVFKTPPILLGDDTASGFADQGNFLLQCKTYYNEITDVHRRAVEEDMTTIFSNYAYDINPTNDYTIIPMVSNGGTN